jgi:hypothetical protein
VNVGAGEPVHVPGLAESVRPDLGVPEMDGATVFAGAVGAAAIVTLFGAPTNDATVDNRER